MTQLASTALRRYIDGEADFGEPLGPFSALPLCLQNAIRLILPAEAQLIIFGGPELVALYNDTYAPILGAKHPAALGRPAREYWAELWDDIGPLLQSVMESGKSLSAADRPFYVERHGFPETTFFDISFSPIADDAGKVHGVFCIVAETTNRVRAMADLRRSDTNLRAIVQSAAVGLAQVDAQGLMTMVNAEFATLLGADESDLAGADLGDWVLPEDKGELQALFDNAEGSAPRSLRFRRQDGRPVWLACSISKIADDPIWPKAVQYCLIAMDLTLRLQDRAREEQMGAIIQGSHDAIMAVDLDMRITAWNRGATRLYGYEPEEIIGQSVDVLLPDESKDEEDRILSRIRRGEKVESYETKRRCKDGSEVPVSLTVSPIYDEFGRIIGASKIARDISARLEAERMQMVLLREMKHRVKNILATVLAIARQSLGKSKDPAVTVFNNRIFALARAQDLLTREEHDSAVLSEMLAEVVTPYPAEQFHFHGPVVELNSSVVLSLSLAFHELATNAAKYGALSVSTGRVEVSWQIEAREAEEVLTIVWQERGGTPVTSPPQQGFGTVLIRDILAAELRGKVQLDCAPDGLRFEVVAPLAPNGRLVNPVDRGASEGRVQLKAV